VFVIVLKMCKKFTTFAKSENGGKIKTLVTDPKQLA
jgi:hypothetical protein